MKSLELSPPKPKWSTGLCEPEGIVCCITCCLPCITFGQIAEVLDEGKSSCVGCGLLYGVLITCSCHCLLSMLYREMLRRKYGLPAEPCNDCCVHCCCELCALCQEHNELKARGLDPSKGCCTIFCPCVTFGRNAHMVDEGKSSCCGQGCIYCMLMMVSCHCLYSCVYRQKLRGKYGLPAEPCCDFCVHWFCDPCALCQEHVELKSRGLDPSKGWSGIPTPMRMFR
ncbi:hypothetical protein ACHQM5_014159 [Ranunculus cassubicifolius]